MGLLAAISAALSCTRDVEPTHEHQVVGFHAAALVEITFHNVGSPNMTSSALVASSVAELAALHARDASHATFDLTVPKSTSGAGNATIELSVLSASAMTANGSRYIAATYHVRNAQKTDSVAFNTPRHNLTFVAVSTANTINDTPVLVFKRPNGTPADPALTRQLRPTGLVTADIGGGVKSVSPDVLQVLTEAELAAIGLPSDVTNVFPYGFMVHRTGSTTTRTLEPSPSPTEFQGVASFAYRIPLQPNPADDPSTITVMMLALDDSQIRITQSLEEQNSAGQLSVLQRATSLGASQVRLLAGGSVPGEPTSMTKVFCSVRTAGFPGAPTATLVNVGSSFQSLNPSPYTPGGSVVPRTSKIQATFSSSVQAAGVGSSNFIVRDLNSGQLFRGAPYTTSGAVAATPTGNYFAGTELEVVITSAISCPTPWVGRLRTQTVPSSGTLSSRDSPSAGRGPRAIAVGDFNGDGILDLAVANVASNTVSVFRGSGTGTFTLFGTFSVGEEPLSIVAGDINGDGLLDIVTANSDSHSLSLLIGRGDGTFRTAQSIVVSGSPLQVVLGDLNGDGALDLVVVAGSGSTKVAAILGNGDGTFQPEVATDAQGDPRAVAIGDLNEDGILDLAVARNGNDKVDVLLGVGDGTFSPSPAGTRSNTPDPVFIAIGDLNRDGHLDVVTANSNGKSISVLLGNGHGTLGDEHTFDTGPSGPNWVAIGDMNGDGILDLVVANDASKSATISVLLGVGNGTFPTHQDYNAGAIEPIYVVVADLNHDGILDAVFGNGDTNSNAFRLFLGLP